jgi:translation initiation factor 6
LPLFLLDIFNNASIGVFTRSTDTLLLVPPQVPQTKTQKVAKWLHVEAVNTTIGNSILIGALTCANSNGVVLPHFTQRKETKAIASTSDLNLTIMDTKRTAYGNLALVNDSGAIVAPRLERREVGKIRDALDVEVVPGTIAGLPYVGSLATATNKGVLAHPLITEEERNLLEDVLQVPVDVGTINCGVPYVATGLVGNKYSAVAGFMTTGPEMFIIEQALDVIKDE